MCVRLLVVLPVTWLERRLFVFWLVSDEASVKEIALHLRYLFPNPIILLYTSVHSACADLDWLYVP